MTTVKKKEADLIVNNKINKGSVTNSKASLEQERFNEFLSRQVIESVFASGSQLSQMLINKFNVSSEYARKIIQRAADSQKIKSSKPYTFGKGQYIYVTPTNRINISHVLAVCKKSRPPLYRLIKTLIDNGGIVSKYEAMKITASPNGLSSTKVEILDDMVKLLGRMDLAYEKRDIHDINYILLKENSEMLDSPSELSLMNNHFNKMVIDCSLIPDILRWMININLIDNSNVIYRNKKTPGIGANHNNLLWDAFSYTKTTGINEIVGAKADTKEKQTMVALDVVLSVPYNEVHLDGFYNRIQINVNSVKGKKRKILPVVIYRECNDYILNKMKKLGFLAFDIGSIFGAKIYSVLKRLNEVNQLFTSDRNVEASIEAILEDIRNAGQEDALKDLKGVLFETMMYPVISRLFSEATIDRGKTLTMVNEKGEKEYYEYDYIVNSNHPKEIVIIELKGYLSSATIPLGNSDTKSSLRWFFLRTPFAAKYFNKDISDGKKMRAVYMTSAQFWDDGRAFIGKMNEGKLKPKFLNVGYERTDLLALLEELEFHNEIKLIKKFYTNHA